jgi:hypothetical protein
VTQCKQKLKDLRRKYWKGGFESSNELGDVKHGSAKARLLKELKDMIELEKARHTSHRSGARGVSSPPSSTHLQKLVVESEPCLACSEAGHTSSLPEKTNKLQREHRVTYQERLPSIATILQEIDAFKHYNLSHSVAYYERALKRGM